MVFTLFALRRRFFLSDGHARSFFMVFPLLPLPFLSDGHKCRALTH